MKSIKKEDIIRISYHLEVEFVCNCGIEVQALICPEEIIAEIYAIECPSCGEKYNLTNNTIKKYNKNN